MADTPGAEVDIRAVAADSADALHCLAAYVRELNARADRAFDPTQGSTANPGELTPPAGRFVVVYRDGVPVGCGGVKHLPGARSDIKRMWVSPAARGLGLGRRLLAVLEDDARAAGAAVARLETNAALVEAIALYRSAGYVEVEPFNDEPFADHWFEKRLDA